MGIQNFIQILIKFTLKKNIEITGIVTEFITLLCLFNFCWHDALDEWDRLLIQFDMFRKFYDKNGNLMILDNSIIDYARMLLYLFDFFLFTEKYLQILARPVTHEFTPKREARFKRIWARLLGYIL